MKSYQHLYQHFLKAQKPHVQHYASHSHHFWPDVTRDAQIQYWDDSARLVDEKWSYFFEIKIPETQYLIAEVLNLTYPKQIIFAPNTHEFIVRLMSCFETQKKPVRILTTNSEFYSFKRQADRWVSAQMADVTEINAEPFATFHSRFKSALQKSTYDIVFLSHVFFNSGFVVPDIEDLVQSFHNPEGLFVLDGYHGFMALPTNLKKIENQIFYIAGSYKYAQGGEGCCFMSVPMGHSLTPTNTGWFAGFGQLTEASSSSAPHVAFSQDGFKFAGSTLDYTALYRLCAVLKLFKTEKITVDCIHDHVLKLQNNFLHSLENWQPQSLEGIKVKKNLNESNQLNIQEHERGHFLTYDLKSEENCKFIHDILKSKGILTDYRGSRLRFGFGLYQNPEIKWFE